MTSSIREIFTRIAPFYDRVNGVLTLSMVKRHRRKMISEIKRKGKLRVLDLCAGTLECTLEVIRQCQDATIMAVDFSEAMLDVGLKKVPESKRSQIQTICADVLDIDFPENSFDAIVCGWGIRNIIDKNLILQKVGKWLSAGGQLIILDAFRPTGVLKKLIFNSFGERVVSFVGGLISRDRAAYDYLIPSINETLSPGEFAAMLEKKGFLDIIYRSLFFGTHSLFACRKG